MARMKTPGQKGKIGAWLSQVRRERGFSSGAKARAEIERLTGWRISPSVYGEWESGTRVPADENLARLEAFFGPMPRDAVEATDDAAALVRLADAQERTAQLLERQTAVIERQVAALESLVLAVREESKDLLGVLAGMTGALGYIAGNRGAAPEQTDSGSATPHGPGDRRVSS